MRTWIVPALAVFALAVGCRSEQAGFRLPAGDAEAGRAAFADLQCHTCHEVKGAQFPAPTANPPIALVLGGETWSEPTDGYLVTAIINPSHNIHSRTHASLRAGHLSRMGDYSDVMSVRQLVDIVAFLHRSYTAKTPPTPVASR